MPSMKERVAMALAQAAGDPWNARSFAETLNGDSPEEMREYYRELAEAAIRALMPPGVHMCEAAYNACDWIDAKVPAEKIGQAITAALQAALNE